MGIAGDGPLGENFSTGSGAAQTIRSLSVSSGYLPTLGIPALHGPHLHARRRHSRCTRHTVILSESLWRHSLNADPNILGRTIHINADPYTVIGVMPASFATVESPDVWQPLQLSSNDPGYQGTNYQMIARLKPGVSIAQASAELGDLTQAIFRQFPGYLKWGRPGGPRNRESIWPLQQIIVSGARSSLLALSGAVLAVLLMACLNLAGLMTGRSIARRSEVALRTALGASPATILRLLLTESLVLAMAGSLLGLVFAQAAVPALLNSSPIDLPQLQHASINLGAILFTVCTGCATTLLFGLLPALGIFRTSVLAGLGNMRTTGVSVPQQRLGKSLIVAQVALATTLLSVGALLLSVFVDMRSVPPGVQPQHLYALQANLKGNAYNSSLHSQQFINAVEQRLRAIPGVGRVATINGLPLDRGLNNSGGPADHPDQIGYTETRFVTPGYFRTAGSPILAGSDISAADTATSQPVALINERAAKRWFPNRSPIGEFIISGGGKPRRVVGLVANVHDASLAAGISPTVYVPYAQVDDETMKTINGWFATTFVLRTIERGNTPDPDIAAAASAAISAVDPEVPASKFASMQSFIDHDVAAPRFFSWLAAAFALFALLLTLIGLFGLLSYQVASRTRELGVRMALGAQRYQVLLMILNSGLTLTSLGLVLGVAGSVALRSIVTSLLSDTVGISKTSSLLGHQAAAVAAAAVAMCLAAVIACVIPAKRAASVNPTEALRTE
jgi:predicted permease